MGVETMVIATAATAAAAGGMQYYEGRKQRRIQKRYKEDEEAIQAEEKADALRTRKKQIDKMRKNVLAPQLSGGRQSLIGGGGETGVPLTSTLG